MQVLVATYIHRTHRCIIVSGMHGVVAGPSDRYEDATAPLCLR